jgi:hypothetical protein
VYCSLDICSDFIGEDGTQWNFNKATTLTLNFLISNLFRFLSMITSVVRAETNRFLPSCFFGSEIKIQVTTCCLSKEFLIFNFSTLFF